MRFDRSMVECRNGICKALGSNLVKSRYFLPAVTLITKSGNVFN